MQARLDTDGVLFAATAAFRAVCADSAVPVAEAEAAETPRARIAIFAAVNCVLKVDDDMSHVPVREALRSLTNVALPWSVCLAALVAWELRVVQCNPLFAALLGNPHRRCVHEHLVPLLCNDAHRLRLAAAAVFAIVYSTLDTWKVHTATYAVDDVPAALAAAALACVQVAEPAEARLDGFSTDAAVMGRSLLIDVATDGFNVIELGYPFKRGALETRMMQPPCVRQAVLLLCAENTSRLKRWK